METITAQGNSQNRGGDKFGYTEEAEKEEMVITEASSPLFTLVKGSLGCMLRGLQEY